MANKSYPRKAKVIKTYMQVAQETKIEQAIRIRRAMHDLSLAIKAERQNTSSG